MRHEGVRVTLGRMQNPVRGFLHGTAALGSVVGAFLLWSRAAGNPMHQIALLVFGAGMVGLYTVSSLYHSVPWRAEWKGRMQRIDHAMIYVQVAGTYTPIAFIVLSGWQRVTALAVVWSVAAIGIAQKVLWPHVGAWLSITLQTMQGWFALLFLVPLVQRLPWPALALGVLGGVFYTVGMVMFVLERPRLWPHVFSYHEVFHVMVVAGSVAHYVMIFAYVAVLTPA
jgi:hemolysin III